MIKQNAVIYARYSCSNQTEQSIEGQIRVCTEFAEKQGLNIINTYIDRAMSGTNDNRPAFQQMLQDSAKKKFQYVIVYKLDRFARNRYDSANNKATLKKNGVQLLSACEQISNSPEGIILESLLEGFAEYYSAELSQKVKRGLKQSVLNGNFLGGTILYGYKVENKKIVVDPVTSQAVKFAFNEYALGKTRKQIIEELNNKGYRTLKNKKFTEHSLQHTFSNKKYIGIFEYDGEEYENIYPAIIDKITFNAVQTRLKDNKKAPAKAKAKTQYILTGLTFCGECGANFVGISGTSKNKQKHYYYSCAEKYKNHTCKIKTYNKEWLEDYVTEKTCNYVLNKTIIDIIAKGIVLAYNESSISGKIKELEKQIKAIDSKQDKIYELYKLDSSANIRTKLSSEMDDLQLLKEDLTIELGKLKLTSCLKPTQERVRDWLVQFMRMANFEKLEDKQKLVNMFINSIYIYNDCIAIFYNWGEDNERLPFDQANELIKLAIKQNTEFVYVNDNNDIINKSRVHILNHTDRQAISNMNTCIYIITSSVFGIVLIK